MLHSDSNRRIGGSEIGGSGFLKPHLLSFCGKNISLGLRVSRPSGPEPKPPSLMISDMDRTLPAAADNGPARPDSF